MNYLSEIVAFTEWKEVNQLPASAIALWYELMAICNKTGWQQEFTVPNGLLQIKAGLSRKEFEHARQLLIQAGRIQYKKSNRVNQAGKYEIIPFVQNGQQQGQQKGQQEGQQQGQQKEHRADNERGTLYKHKQNETKNEIATTTDSDASAPNFVELLNQEFGRLCSPTEIETLQAFITDDGMDPLVICEAIKRTRKRGNTSVDYTEGILRRWRDAGVRDMAGVSRYDLAYEQAKGSKVVKSREPEKTREQQLKKDKYKDFYLS